MMRLLYPVGKLVILGRVVEFGVSGYVLAILGCVVESFVSGYAFAIS